MSPGLVSYDSSSASAREARDAANEFYSAAVSMPWQQEDGRGGAACQDEGDEWERQQELRQQEQEHEEEVAAAQEVSCM